MRNIVDKEEKGSHKKEPTWNKKNPVHQQMKDDIVEGSGKNEKQIEGAIPIPSYMHWHLAKQLRQVYRDMADDLFKGRLSGMRKIVYNGLDRALEDACCEPMEHQ